MVRKSIFQCLWCLQLCHSDQNFLYKNLHLYFFFYQKESLLFKESEWDFHADFGHSGDTIS